MSQTISLTLRPAQIAGSRAVAGVTRFVGNKLQFVSRVPDPFADDAPRSAASSLSGSRRRGVWALMDQGVVSLGNCATNVILMRGIAAHEFGLFSMLLEMMLFLNTLQAALVIYPLSVRGAILDDRALRRLSGACLMLTALIALPLGLAVATMATVMASSLVVGLFAIAALLLWQCQETLRRAMMSHGGQKRCLPGDAISYLGQAACVFMLARAGTLNIASAFAVMALTSGAAVVVQSIQIRPTFAVLRSLRDTALDFWRLGRWIMFGNFTLIITTLGCSWTLAGLHGTTEVAQFQALANVLKLSNPMTICMAGLIVPAAARAFRTEGLPDAKRVSMRFGLLTASALVPYYLFLLIFPTVAIRLVCGANPAYAELGNELRAFVLWYSTLLVAQIAGSYLNAVEQSKRSFNAQLAQTAATLIITIPLTAFYGLDGLLLGGVIANTVMAAALVSWARHHDETVETAHSRFVHNEMHNAAKAA